jgi:hypothetical protein
MESPPRKSRTGTIRTTTRPIADRIRDGRDSYRVDELPRPRLSGQRTGRPPDSSSRKPRPWRPRSARAAPESRDRARDGRKPHREDELPNERARDEKRADKDRRREINMSVSTRAGAVCGFSYACRHGTGCRGIHSESEKVLFRQRDRKVAILEREAGCAYCRVGKCKYGAKCRGQTAMRSKNRNDESTDKKELPAPRKLIRKRGRRRPRGKKVRADITEIPEESDSHRGDSNEYDEYNGFRISELAADIQKALGGIQQAGGHAAGGQGQVAGRDHHKHSSKKEQEQQHHQHERGRERSNSSGDSDTPSERGSDRGRDRGHDRCSDSDSDPDSDPDCDPDSDPDNDPDSDSHSDSSSDSRQCCADLQMMMHIPSTFSEMMAQRQMESQCHEEGVIRFYGLWFCKEHAPRPSRPVVNKEDPWECNSTDPPCEQPGHTLHSGLWFCSEHALQDTQRDGWRTLIDNASESLKGLNSNYTVLVISMLLWWEGAHWGWHAAAALVVIAGWISSAINSLQEEIAHEKEARAQEEERQEESSRAHRQAIKRDIMERESRGRHSYDY